MLMEVRVLLVVSHNILDAAKPNVFGNVISDCKQEVFGAASWVGFIVKLDIGCCHLGHG